MNKRITIIATLLLLFAQVERVCAQENGINEDFAAYVDQRIGTGGHGHVFLGANVPNGLVQNGPTQHTRGWDWCSGYHDSDSIIIGFGTMHLSGTGIGELGDIAMLPVSEARQHEVKFSHEDEQVAPGYYSLQLHQPNVKVELTATPRVAFQRYTPAEGSSNYLLRLNLSQCIGWDRMTSCHFTQETPTRITGFRRSRGWAQDRRIYFVMDFSQPVEVVRSLRDSLAIIEPKPCQEACAGKPLMVKIALSPVSISGASENLATELAHWDFDGVVKEARRAWNKALSKIKIQTQDASVKKIFYTAMYHLMTAPSVFCDVNGDYRGADGQYHHGNFVNYTTFSLWDTYRAAHPLMTIIFPEKQRDFAETFINIYKQQGDLPVWHLMGNETDCMVGNPGVAVLADLVLKGFVEDKELALEAMKQTSLQTNRQLNLLKQYGYIPYDAEDEPESVAKALEYCLAEDGLAKVAKQLGATEDYNYFYNRSRSYKKYFDKKTGFMRAVGIDGKFREPFSPFKAVHRGDDYTEGNAWQYTWLVPHDVHGLVGLFGGEAKFLKKFDQLFLAEGDLGGEASPDISGLIGQYAHGNEPSHHILYMYNYVGQPWKGAKLLRKVMKEMYTTEKDGLCGNEDVGQMSAWYILSAVGLYQVEPSGGKFIIGTPIVDVAELNVGNGNHFTVKALNNSEQNIYVQSAKLNGKPYTKSYIDYKEIMKGGVLELSMGSKPSKWATAKKDRP